MSSLRYRVMTEPDIAGVVRLYVEYYNTREDGCWTPEKAYRRIHQVWSTEDAFCLLQEEDGALSGFAMGYLSQYDDLVAYDLVEIVIAAGRQGRGLGTALLGELERRVREAGAAMMQLQSVNDEMHAHFYGKMGFVRTTNLLPLNKFFE